MEDLRLWASLSSLPAWVVRNLPVNTSFCIICYLLRPCCFRGRIPSLGPFSSNLSKTSVLIILFQSALTRASLRCECVYGGEGAWLRECVRVQGTKHVKRGDSQIQSSNHLPEAATHLALSSLSRQRQSKTRNGSKGGEVPRRRFSLWRTNLQLSVLTPAPAMATTACPFCAFSLESLRKECGVEVEKPQ